MNIEDRLREAFENEAEQMRAPGGVIEDAIRRGKRRRASRFLGGAAIALTLIGGTALAIQLTAGDDNEPEITAEQAQNTTTTIVSEPLIALFDWERVELPVPEGTEIYNLRVQSASGRFVALGEGYSDESGVNSQYIWLSENGRNWTLSSPPSGSGGYSNGEVFSSEEGFIVVERGPLPDQISVLTSRDGLALTRGALNLSGELTNDSFVHFSGGASGNGVHLLAGFVESMPPQPPIILEQAGVVLQEQSATDRVTVSDLATGEAITTISIETLYGGINAEGLVVRDAAGTTVVIIPWDIQAEAYDSAFATSGDQPSEIVLEYNGVRLTLNELEFTYTATDIATGELINEGDQESLYEPGPFVITDPETGETLVEMSMEELYEAQEDSYREFEFSGFEGSRALILRSEDGVEWSEVDVADSLGGSPFDLSGLTYGPEGFVLQAFGYDNTTGTSRALLRSNDGLDWARVADPPFAGQQAFVADNDSYYTVGNVAREGLGIFQSDDLENWERVHTITGPRTWINHLSSGQLGLVAIGQTDNTVEPALTVSKDGKTLHLDSNLGSLTVTDDATNEVLADIAFDIYDEQPPEGIVVADDGSTVEIYEAGALIMTLTEADMEEAYQETDFPDSFPESVVFFSPDGDEWRRASTTGLEIAYLSAVAVGSEVIVISGDPIYDYSQETVTIGGGNTATTLRYADAGVPPAPFVWVGTPR